VLFFLSMRLEIGFDGRGCQVPPPCHQLLSEFSRRGIVTQELFEVRISRVTWGRIIADQYPLPAEIPLHIVQGRRKLPCSLLPDILFKLP
jgi:hypothetical protein